MKVLLNKMAQEFAEEAGAAASGQMYNLVQDATTASVKTIGESLTSTARKQ